MTHPFGLLWQRNIILQYYVEHSMFIIGQIKCSWLLPHRQATCFSRVIWLSRNKSVKKSRFPRIVKNSREFSHFDLEAFSHFFRPKNESVNIIMGSQIWALHLGQAGIIKEFSTLWPQLIALFLFPSIDNNFREWMRSKRSDPGWVTSPLWESSTLWNAVNRVYGKQSPPVYTVTPITSECCGHCLDLYGGIV